MRRSDVDGPPLPVEHADGARAEAPRFPDKPLHHRPVRLLQIIKGEGVELREHSVSGEGVLDGKDILERGEDSPSLEDKRRLLDGKGVSLDRER